MSPSVRAVRLVDATAPIREAYPAAHADLAALLSALGSPTTLLVVLATLYWLSPRRREVALVIGAAVAGVGVLVALKALFALPRPPPDLALVAADGYGFPSGHAFGATVVYGGLAARADRRGRVGAVAGALVGAVALSRVVLGVHYLGDVLAAVALGVAFLAAMDRLAAGDPGRAFAVAVCCAVAALVVAGPSDDVALAVGGAFGGIAAAGRIGTLPAPRTRREAAVLVCVGAALAAAGLVVEALVAGAAVAAVYAGTVWAVLLAPALGGPVADALAR